MLYRTVVTLLQPYLLLLILLGSGLILAWRQNPERRRELRLALAAWLLLWIVSLPVFGHFALGSLEWHYPIVNLSPKPQDTLIVLSGSVLVDDQAGSRYRVGPDTFYRCMEAAELYRRASGCRMILSGGKVVPHDPGPSLAQAMKEFLLTLGVREEDIILEDRSATTWENALYSKTLLHDPAGEVYLVTDQLSMYRAIGCFRKLDVAVIPAPCNPRTSRFEAKLKNFLPSPDGLLAIHDAAHEWLGVGWYLLQKRN